MIKSEPQVWTIIIPKPQPRPTGLDDDNSERKQLSSSAAAPPATSLGPPRSETRFEDSSRKPNLEAQVWTMIMPVSLILTKWDKRYPSTPTPYTPHHMPHTLHPTPYTLHPTLYTPHPTPYTLHLALHTRHPAPHITKYRVSPNPSTINPKP